MCDNPIRAPCNADTINKAPQDLAVSQRIQDAQLSSKTLEQLSGRSHLLDTSGIEVKQYRQNTASVSSSPPDDDDALLPHVQLQPQLPCNNNNAKDGEITELRIDTHNDVSCHENSSAVSATLDIHAAQQGKYKFFLFTCTSLDIKLSIYLDSA